MNLRGDVDLFNNGQWSELVNDVVAQQCRESQANQYAQEDEQVKRGMAAQSKIQLGQVSRVRQALTGAELAPKTEETFQLLQGRRPQAQIRAISDEAMQFTPEHPVQLKAKLFTKCLSGAPDQHQGQVGACSASVWTTRRFFGQRRILHGVVLQKRSPRCS